MITIELNKQLMSIVQGKHDLIGIRIVKNGTSFMVGLSWLVDSELQYQNFYNNQPESLLYSFSKVMNHLQFSWY